MPGRASSTAIAGIEPARAAITRVDIRGDEAEVTFVTTSKDSTDTSTVKLKLEDGKWKVSP